MEKNSEQSRIDTHTQPPPEKVMSENYTEAYEAGQRACFDGFAQGSNPYWPHDPCAASYWCQGFDDAMEIREEWQS